MVLLGCVRGIAGLRPLGGVHGHVGSTHQGVGVGAVLGHERDADARSHLQFVSVQDEGLVQGGDESLPGQLGGETSVNRYENGKFVASQTGNGVRLVEYVSKAPGDVPQQTIPIMVPKGIVDLLEAIHS